jgi:hypothetical protein
MQYGLGNGKLVYDDLTENALSCMTVIDGSGNIEHIEADVYRNGKSRSVIVEWRC